MVIKKKEKKSIYEEITEKIIDALEAGVAPWSRPWETAQFGEHRNAVTNRSYRGINIMLLNLATTGKGYVDPRWLTFRNAEVLGGHVRKGEKGVGVVFWKFLTVTETENANQDRSENGDDKKIIPLTRMYTIFNAEQCEGLELTPLEKPVGIAVGIESKNNEDAEKILSLPNLKHGGDKAYYSQARDLIVMPVKETFENLEFFYSTFYHEILHWTGHPNRLNRKFGTRFGDHDYAFEELVAEIGAAFLGAGTGVPFENMRHPEYINFWLQILKKDTKAIFTAGAKAQGAADFVLEKSGLSESLDKELPAVHSFG
jgi:antirestriction protein ArdC